MTVTSRIRYPHTGTAALDARRVALAYQYPVQQFTGHGVTVGIIELGGALNDGDVRAEAAALGLPAPNLTVIDVDRAPITSDGPNGADAEVMLDVEIVAAIAPAAAIRCYFAPNTDAGFLDAIRQATTECDYVSISWGGPETSWDPAVMDAYEQVFAAARAKGVTVFCAAGDTGSTDGTSRDTADFPASSPSVVGCGGTRLTLNADGTRAAETTWNDNPTTSATGGGVSAHFPGRMVPDLAGNADPRTGYQIVVDGQQFVVGGTSAVAPLYAGLAALLREAYGQPFDMLNLILTNPTVCFDVTAGDNGGYKAGPGRDQVTGFGVVDGGRMLSVLMSGVQVPAPGGNPTPTPAPDPTPTPEPPAPSPTPAPPAPAPDPTPPPIGLPTLPPVPAPAYVYRATIVSVHDGDTLTATVSLGFDVTFKTNVRLSGINARELSAPGGKEAGDNLRALLPAGTVVTLTSERWDKYGGRTDATITYLGADGQPHDLVTDLIADGWGAPYRGTGPMPVPPWPRVVA